MTASGSAREVSFRRGFPLRPNVAETFHKLGQATLAPCFPFTIQKPVVWEQTLLATEPTASAGRKSPSTGKRTRFASCRRSEEHTSELQSRGHLVCRLLLEKKKHLTDRGH